MTYFLRSARLGFRTWTADDVELAAALWGDPDVGRHIGGALDRGAAIARLGREIAAQGEHGIQYWPIFLLDGGAHVGCCGLRPYKPALRMPELGVHIRPPFWRQGLALEAARAVVAHAFDRLAVAAIFAGHNPANGSSRALLARLGFRYTHDELYPPTGQLHPSYRLDP